MGLTTACFYGCHRTQPLTEWPKRHLRYSLAFGVSVDWLWWASESPRRC